MSAIAWKYIKINEKLKIFHIKFHIKSSAMYDNQDFNKFILLKIIIIFRNILSKQYLFSYIFDIK